MPRDLSNVDLNLLIVFNTLADEEHLTRTAEKLHLSQPAVSNALSRLRELFNDDLFVRAPRGMRPTQKTLALKEPIKKVLGIIEGQILSSDEFDFRTAKDRFSISVNGYAEFSLFPILVKHIRQNAPNVLLDIYPEADAQSPEKLRSGELDIVLDYLPINGKDFLTEKFFEEELVAVAAKSHPELKDGLSTPLYNSLPHLSIHPRNHRGSHTEILLGRKQIHRNIVMNVSNLISLPPLVANSDMICTLPKRLATRFAQSLAIEIHELPFEIEQVPIYMIYHRDRKKDASHCWLREQLETLATLAG